MNARLQWLRVVVPAAYVCGMLLSLRLWFDLGRRYLTVVAVTIAICETAIGVGLLFRRTRHVAVVLACVMHSIILLNFILPDATR